MLICLIHICSAALQFSSKEEFIDPGRIQWPRSSWVNHPIEFSSNHGGENVTLWLQFSVSSKISNGLVEVHFPAGFDLTGSEFYLEEDILTVPIKVDDISETIKLELSNIILPESPGAYGPFALYTRNSVNGQVVDVNKIFCSVGVLEANLPPPSDSLEIAFFDVNMDTVRAKSTILFTFTLENDLWKNDFFVINVPEHFSLLNPVCRSEDLKENLNHLNASAADVHQFGCEFEGSTLTLFGLTVDIDISELSDTKSLKISLSVTGFTNPKAAFDVSEYQWDLTLYRYSTSNVIQSFHGSGPETYPGVVSLNSWKPYGSFDTKKIVPGLVLFMDLSFSPDHYIPKGGKFVIEFEGVDLETTSWKSDKDQSVSSGSTGYYYIDPYIGASCTVSTTEIECSGFDSDIIARNTLTLSLLIKFTSTSANIKSITTYYNSETIIDTTDSASLLISYSSTVSLSTSYKLLFSKSLDTTSSNRVCDTGGGDYYLVIYFQVPVALTLDESIHVYLPLSTTNRADFSLNFGSSLSGYYSTSSSSQPTDLSSATPMTSITVTSAGIIFSVISSANDYVSVALYKNDGSGSADQLSLPYIGSNEWTRYESRMEVVVSNAYYVYSAPFTILPHDPLMSFDVLCTDSGKAGLPARITGSMNFDYSSLYYLYIDIAFDSNFLADLGSGLADGEDYPFALDSTSSLPVSSKMKINQGSTATLTISGITSVLKTSVIRAFFPIGSLTAGTYSVKISLYSMKKDRTDVHFEVFSKTVSRTIASNTKNWQTASTTASTAQVAQFIASSSEKGLDLTLQSASTASDTVGLLGLVLPKGFQVKLPSVTDGTEDLVNVLGFTSSNIDFAFPGILASETSSLSLSKSTSKTLHFIGIRAAVYFSYSSPSVTIQPYEAKSTWNSACESITGTLPTLTLTRGILAPSIIPISTKGRGPGSLQKTMSINFETVSPIPEGSYIEISIDSEWVFTDNSRFEVSGIGTYSSSSVAPYKISEFGALDAGTLVEIDIYNLMPPVNSGSSDVKRGCIDSISIYAGSSTKLIDSWQDDLDSTSPDTCITVKPQDASGIPSYLELSTFPNTASTDGVSVFLKFSLQNPIPSGGSIVLKSPTSSWALNGDIKNKCWFSLKYSSCSASGNSLSVVLSEDYSSGNLTLLIDDCLDTPININDELSFTISTSFKGVVIDKDSDVTSSQVLNLINPPSAVLSQIGFEINPINAFELAIYTFKFSISVQITKGDEIWIKFPDIFDPFIGKAEVRFSYGEPDNYYLECESLVLGDISCKADHWHLVVNGLNTVSADSVIELNVMNVANPGMNENLPSFKVYLVDQDKNIKAMKSDFSAGEISNPALSNINIRSIQASNKFLQEDSDYTFTIYLNSLTFSKDDLLLIKFPSQYLLDWDLNSDYLSCDSKVFDESDSSISLSTSTWDLSTNCSYIGTNIISMNISESGSWTKTDRIILTIKSIPNPEWGFDRSDYFDGQSSSYFESLSDWTGQFEIGAYKSDSALLLGKTYGNLNSGFVGLKSSGMKIKIGNYDPMFPENHLILVPGTQSSELEVQVTETWGLMAKKLVLKPLNHEKNVNTLEFASDIHNFYILQGQQSITFKISTELGAVNSLVYIKWESNEYSLLGLTEPAYSKPCKTLVEVYSGKVFELVSTGFLIIEKSSESKPIKITSPVPPSSNFTLSLSFQDATLNGIELSPISLTYKAETTEQYFTIKVSDNFNGKLDTNYSIQFGITGPDSTSFSVPSFIFQVTKNVSSVWPSIEIFYQNLSRTSASLYVKSDKSQVVYWQLMAYGTPIMTYSELVSTVKALNDPDGSGIRMKDQIRKYHQEYEIEPVVNETWVEFQKRKYYDALGTTWVDVSYIEGGASTLIAHVDWLWADTKYLVAGFILNNSTALYNCSFTTDAVDESVRLELLFSGLIVESKAYPLTTIVAYSLGVPDKQLKSLKPTSSRQKTSTTLFSWIFFPNRAWDISPLDLYKQVDQVKLASDILNSGIENLIISFSSITLSRSSFQNPYWTNSGYPSISNITSDSISISLKSAVTGSMCCIAVEYFPPSTQNSTFSYPDLSVTPTQVLLQLSQENLNSSGTCIENQASIFSEEILMIFNLTANTNYTATCAAFNDYPLWPSASAYSESIQLPSFDFKTLKEEITESEVSSSIFYIPLILGLFI